MTKTAVVIPFFDKVTKKKVPDEKQNPLWDSIDALVTVMGGDLKSIAQKYFDNLSPEERDTAMNNLIG